ncbi:MAG: hypothetical protein KatS3mg117_3458 [Geminicoccaceae bacterium]|nr:MAG: hypothetical protein KatS3mg117_3458 [Geminicoccaceae bacterium]
MGEIVAALGDRAFGAVLLIFAAPNILPVTLPGTSSVTALPILLVGIQLLVGWRRLHLPDALARRSFARRQLAIVVERLGPWLERAERLARPRWPVLTTPLAERLIGLAVLVLSVILFLPLPSSNIPPGSRSRSWASTCWSATAGSCSPVSARVGSPSTCSRR